MNPLVVFVLFACVLSASTVLSFDNLDDFIRFPLTPRRRRASDGSGLTKITMANIRDVRYGVPVELGTPPQKFTLVLDTGSSDLVVLSKNNKKKAESQMFDETASTTYKDGKGDFFLGYAGTSISGNIAEDTVSLGGLTIKNQPFALANDFTNWPGMDGILGFSYPSVAQTDSSSWIDRLYEQGSIKKRIACVKLRRKKEMNSEFIVGGCDVEAENWLPVLKVNGDYTGWRVTLTKIVLRSTTDNSELLSIETNNEAVLDTGAGDTVDIPKRFLDPIINRFGASWSGDHFLVDCANRTSLPDIDFYFGEAIVTMPLDVYSWVYFDECQLGLGTGSQDILFGTMFFNQATVIYDRDNNRVGLTKQ